MSNPFFDHPILNSSYEQPAHHWELDDAGQPTQNIIDSRRRAKFITPIREPRKRKGSTKHLSIVLDEGQGLSTAQQRYEMTSVIINEVRQHVEQWRNSHSNLWQVTPETERLLKHWRHHEFSGVWPFFCQIEAVETAIWLTEVAPNTAAGKRILSQLAAANEVLIACAFNYEAHTTEFNNRGRIPVLKARMNADLHMSDDLKNTGKGNLFVIFGEPDIDSTPLKMARSA